MFSLYSLMWRPIKQVLYMSRVVRKETLHKYKSLGRKSDLEIWIPVTSIDGEVSSFKLRQIQLSRSYQGAVEETGAFSIDPPAIERCRDCDNNQLKSSIDSLAIERCRAAVEIFVHRCRAICPALMNSFSSLVSWSNLHGFNTRLEQHISWSIKHILDLPK